MTTIPAAVAEKIGKILPRLASDHTGEILATVAAIRRTLSGAGLDLNDLGQHLSAGGIPTSAASGFDWTDIVRPARDWAEAARKAQEAASAASAAAKPAKPKREPSPWPSFSTMRHQQRCEWLQTAEGMASIIGGIVDRAVFAALKAKIISRPHEMLTRKETNLFNRIVRAAWDAGVQWGVRKAA